MVSDETLFDNIRQGDMGAFDVLYERYERKLFSFILPYLKRREEAEEVFHETFMAVLESKNVIFDRASFNTWLYQVARNKALNRLRTRGHENKIHPAQESESQNEQTSTQHSPNHVVHNGPHEIFEQRQILTALARAVEKLSHPLAEVYHLRASGVSYEAMAFILELPMGTVKSRLHEMVSQLRKEMKIWIAD